MARKYKMAEILSEYPDLKKEFNNWEKWVRADIPQLFDNVDLKIRCTYTEAFSMPFSFIDLLQISYGSANQRIAIREEEIDTVLDELLSGWKAENNSVENIVRDYPTFFVLVPQNGGYNRYSTSLDLSSYDMSKENAGFFDKIKNFFKSSDELKHNFIGYFNLTKNGKLEVGRATGYYYIDLYGHIWIEMKGNYQKSGPNVLNWVKWNSVNCKNRDKITNLLSAKRNQIMQTRITEENKFQNSTFSSVGEFVKNNALLLSAGALLLPILKKND